MAINWFYADPHNQQQGPVEAAWLADAYRSGAVTADTLVWREGLAGWMPLRQVAAQMGLIVVGGSAPPPLRPPPPGSGERFAKPRGSSSSGVVIAIVVVFGGLMVLSILAAIALPAYQDYTIRAKVTGALIQASALKIEVAEYYQTQNKCPRNGDEGFKAAGDYSAPNVSAINIGPLKTAGDCALQVMLKDIPGHPGAKLQLSLDKQGTWHSSSDLPAKFLPLSMRDSQ